MARAYSYDLRLRVINFVINGNTVKEAARIYKISRKTIIEWKKLKKQTGDVKARTGYHNGHRRVITDIDKFKEFIEINSDKSSVELAKAWHQQVSASAIIRLLNKLGYSYKKNFYASKKRCWVTQ
jgi:transposase